MQKSKKLSINENLIGVESINKSLGLINYFSDLDHNSIATESLNNNIDLNKPVCVPVNNTQASTIIDKKDGIYHVYLQTNEVSVGWWTTNINSFTRWALSLNSNDVVHIHQTGNISYFPQIVQIIVVLNTLCLARTVFIVDHIIESPFILLACKEVSIEDLGAVYFTNIIDEDAKKCERILRPLVSQLFNKAVEYKFLTSGEVDSILDDNNIIFKTARELCEISD